MPQINQIETFASQLFWLALTFTILYFIIARKVIPLVHEVLQHRKDKVAGDLEKASASRQEAEALEASYKSALEKTNAQATELVTKAQVKAEKDATAKHSKLDDSLHQKVQDAEKRIAAARDKALGEIAEVSSGLALEVVSLLTDIKAPKQQAEKAAKAASAN